MNIDATRDDAITADRSRQEFEAWYQTWNKSADAFARNDRGEYADETTYAAFIGWEAAIDRAESLTAQDGWIEIAVHGPPKIPFGRDGIRVLATSKYGCEEIYHFWRSGIWSTAQLSNEQAPTHYRSLPAPAHNGDYRP